MSFTTALESVIFDFCDKIAVTFNLDQQKVRDVWSSQTSSPKTSPSRPNLAPPPVSSQVSNSDTEITREKILSANKDMLAAMCKKVGLKVTGKKEELTQRLSEFLASDKDKKEPPKVEKKTDKNDPPVVKSIKERTAELAIRKNKFGNFEHSQTGLVFNTDKMVCGHQSDDGKIIDLNNSDIELCKKYKFPFKIPENLNTTKTLDDVKIEDLDEEVLDEDDLEDDLEEEDDVDDVPDDE